MSIIKSDIVTPKVEAGRILSDFNENLNFLDRFSKYPNISNFMNILPLKAESFHAGERTDRRDAASSRFSQFC
jgi:hypothetical protein